MGRDGRQTTASPGSPERQLGTGKADKYLTRRRKDTKESAFTLEGEAVLSRNTGKAGGRSFKSDSDRVAHLFSLYADRQ